MKLRIAFMLVLTFFAALALSAQRGGASHANAPRANQGHIPPPKKELPFDYLTPQWHVEDGTENFMVGISGRWGDRFHSLTVYTHYLDSPPEPKEMYPPGCCAVGTLQISTSEPPPPEALEICGTPERWLVHHHDKWMPLSASYVAFLMGINQRPPSALQNVQDYRL